MTKEDEAVQRLFGLFKMHCMELLNDTADEFDAKELTDDQRRTYNEFVAAFGQKILDAQLEVEAPDEQA